MTVSFRFLGTNLEEDPLNAGGGMLMFRIHHADQPSHHKRTEINVKPSMIRFEELSIVSVNRGV